MKSKYLLFLTACCFAVVTYLTITANSTRVFSSEDFLKMKIQTKNQNQPKPGYPDLAMQWYYEQRAYPIGYIPENWREEAMEHIQRENKPNNAFLNAAALNWSQVGPGNYGGRVRSIVIHPTNPDIVYIGAVAGGVWKTTDGGNSWVPLKDFMENLAVCSMVMDPTNSNIIYAGTGEGFFNLDAVRGDGIFKTTDAGASWFRLSSTQNQNFYYVNKLEIDKNNNTLWAGTRKGLYKSTDGGSTFTGVLTGTGGTDVNCTDVEIAESNPSTIYAAFGIFSQSSLYISTDGGANFQLSLSNAAFGRMEVAVGKTNTSVAYVSIMDVNTYGVGTMGVTINKGASWSNITVPGPSYSGANNYAGGQGWYDNIIYVDPDNVNVLYAGGIDFWKSTNGGSAWTQKTNWYSQSGAPPYMHADQHAIAFAPSNSNIMYVGNDGGVWKSTNKGETFTSLNNGLFITQFYYGAVAPSGTKYYGGTQDNGTLGTTGSTSWFELLGGDGGATEVDFNNPNNIYMEYINLAIFKSTDGGATFFKAMNGIPTGPNFYDGTTDRTLFISPFSMDPNNSATIVAGTYRVWRTTNGAANWNAISGDLTGDGTGSQGARISTVIIARGNSNVIYVGCTNGRVQVSTDGGGTWNLRTSGLPNAYVTRIATAFNDPGTAYATFSGYGSGQKVYKTTNYGQNWTNISSNLPNLPVNCVITHPTDNNTLYVGTDLGVFTTTDAGQNWVQDAGGMANVTVHDLDYRSSDNKIFAATHGRSMYAASITGGGGGGQLISLVYDDGQPSGGYYWSQNGNGSANRMTPTVPGAQVINMSIYFTSVSSGTATYQPIVLGSSGGQPGSNLANLPQRTAPTVPGWDELNLASYNITVSNDFFVGLIYDGVNAPVYGYDPVNNNRAWDLISGSWSSWNETYFMRATIMTPTSVVEIDTRVPDKFSLDFNYPNPFNPSTRFRYSLPEGRNVKVIIYDINGAKVTELVNNYQDAGSYEVTWNGKNDFGNHVASGTYFYSVIAGDFVSTKKMILLK